jgi:hypothetical protein
MWAGAILIAVWIVFRAIGAAGLSWFASWKSAFPYAFAVMLIFTAIGHFKRREDQQATVPRWILDPDLVVFVTGVLVSCPINNMAFAVGQLAVFQGASDEHI